MLNSYSLTDLVSSILYSYNALAELSRANCIGICAFLVPANLVTTCLTIAVVLCRPNQVWQAAGIASTFAIIMLLHVWTWFEIGVVMIPTYVLLCLATSCLITNLGAIFYIARSQNKINLGNPLAMYFSRYQYDRYKTR